MNPLSALAIYFIIWWLCLFVVLPFGVRNAHESAEEVDRKSTRLNSSHVSESRMPSSA